jgi:hypothetical protein
MSSTDIAPIPDLAEAIATSRAAPTRVRKLARRAKKVSGRPTKLTIPTAIRILHHILAGNYIGVACAEAGITDVTLRNWKARARELIDDPECDIDELPAEEKIFVDFFGMIKTAEAGAELALLKRAARGEKGWQAAMTVLERRHPERWGRQEKRIHEGDEGRPTVIFIESEPNRQREVAGILEQSGVVNSTAQEVIPVTDPADDGADDLSS